jgi:hypothetical protein
VKPSTTTNALSSAFFQSCGTGSTDLFSDNHRFARATILNGRSVSPQPVSPDFAKLLCYALGGGDIVTVTEEDDWTTALVRLRQYRELIALRIEYLGGYMK